jgi:hypothetical protein
MAAVALTAQNTSDAIIDPALRFLGSKADKELHPQQMPAEHEFPDCNRNCHASLRQRAIQHAPNLQYQPSGTF